MIKKRELDDRVRQLESMFTPLDERVQELDEAMTNQEHNLAVYIKKVNELEAVLGALSSSLVKLQNRLYTLEQDHVWQGPDVHE